MKPIQSLLFRSLVFMIGFTWILNSFLIKDSFSLGKLLDQDLLNSNNEKNPEKKLKGKEPEIPAPITTKGKTNDLKPKPKPKAKGPGIPKITKVKTNEPKGKETEIPTPTKVKTFKIKDGFLNKAKIPGLEIGIDTTVGDDVFNAMKSLAEEGLVVAKLDIKGNDQVKAKVMEAIRNFTDLNGAPAAGSYLEEIVNRLAPTAADATRTDDFTKSQVLVLPNSMWDTFIYAYQYQINTVNTDIAIQTISVRIHNGSPYLYIIFKTNGAKDFTIAQTIGIDHITGTGNVTFQTTNIKDLSADNITFENPTAFTGTPDYAGEVTCDAADLDSLQKCFADNGKLVVVTLPFEFFIPATVKNGTILFGHPINLFYQSIFHLRCLKFFLKNYVTVMGGVDNLPANSTMVLINKAIPSGNHGAYREITEADTNFATTARYVSYTGAYGADAATKKKTIVLSLKKFQKN